MKLERKVQFTAMLILFGILLILKLLLVPASIVGSNKQEYREHNVQEDIIQRKRLWIFSTGIYMRRGLGQQFNEAVNKAN